eukprot:CAMPEP_0201866260 /NCGR_PEP_ID=MMETSP0902-20130614/900_1 /ASSEMBLY_ACC=CAM_ASM_000551 /TAXON_ID=420261 /ORGANISM="Thalassiosira antarctica, Strain CCMP982" /LENGTH=434 /DNA_ID=CAMNT_0048391191 /DNA_START=63 /DNA_END=1368 /DNA_ORIENTATION=-
MDESLRQRGWSIHSSDGQQRPRADSQMTCDTEQSMSQEEKIHLLNSAFEGVGDSVDIGDVAVPHKSKIDSPKAGIELELPKKRRKTGEGEAINADNESGGNSSGGGSSSSEDESETGEKLKTSKRPHVQLTTKQQEQLDLAKNKLSKWAARLFDPNRSRGLVETPAVIPLNDEFLKAFGKREKEYDEVSGRVMDIDKTSLDIIDVSDDENETDKKPKSEAKKTDFSELKKCKVKISNMSYKTTSATIARTCGAFGPMLDVNLILDGNGQSSGRAYVVFEDHETAISCADKMNQKQLEGRTLYVSLASKSGRKSFDPSKKQENRYWERDISTKCNYCGEIGHIAKNCTNEQELKPCGLCAEVGHEMWTCPQKSVASTVVCLGMCLESATSEEVSPNDTYAPSVIKVDITDLIAEKDPGMPPGRMQYVCNVDNRDI